MTKISGDALELIVPIGYTCLIVYDSMTIEIYLTGWKTLFAFTGLGMLAAMTALFIFIDMITRGNDKLSIITFSLLGYLLLTRLMLWTF